MNSIDSLPNYLPGEVPNYGIKQQSPQYFQGVDIVITPQLCENGECVSYNDYSLIVALKADLDSPFTVWQGYLNYGIIIVDNIIQINIPAHITKFLPPGIFYVTILGKSRKNINHYAVLFNENISVIPSAASPIADASYSLENIANQNPPAEINIVNSTITVPIQYVDV